MIVVTGATGQLGRLVIEALLKTEKPESIVAAVRTPEKADELDRLGVSIRHADYNAPATLASAFAGADKLLLISSSELGRRVEQHKAAIDAARAAGVGFVAYTSLLHCDTTPLLLADEHRQTELYLQASGLKYALLRNGWYFENQTAAIPQAIGMGAFIGASGEGKFAAASREDFAAAAAAVLTGSGFENTTLELAGDTSYTRTELAAEAGRQAGKQLTYTDLPEAEYRAVLSQFIPPAVAAAVADAEAHAKAGALDDRSGTLSRIIGRPTTSLQSAVAAALK